MASTTRSTFAIDNLPQHLQRKVINALMAGQSFREVAKLGGVSVAQVKSYKAAVFQTYQPSSAERVAMPATWALA
jgi:DNA-directed RNA polymerase specialized sigma24 family protein